MQNLQMPGHEKGANIGPELPWAGGSIDVAQARSDRNTHRGNRQWPGVFGVFLPSPNGAGGVHSGDSTFRHERPCRGLNASPLTQLRTQACRFGQALTVWSYHLATRQPPAGKLRAQPLGDLTSVKMNPYH